MTDAPRTGRYSIPQRIQRMLLRKEMQLESCMEYLLLEGVQGDFVEFGTFRGDSLVHVFHENAAHTMFLEDPARFGLTSSGSQLTHDGRLETLAAKKAMRFVVFDSFEGISAPDEHDHTTFRKGDFYCPLDDFHANLAENNVPRERVVVVKGWFQDTLNATTKKQIELQKVAFVHLDCDLYAPAKLALDFLTDVLVDGALINFDDWYLSKNRPDLGEQRAFHEWLEATGFKANEYSNFRGKAFTIHR